MKEIIRDCFKDLEWYVKTGYFPTLSFKAFHKDSLCFSESVRDSYGVSHSGYEALLRDCLISILRKINDKQIDAETPQRKFEVKQTDNDDNISYFYPFEFEDDDNASTASNKIEPFIYSMFQRDVVFAKTPLERDIDFPLPLDDEDEENKYNFLKHYASNNINQNLTIVLMKKKPDIKNGIKDDLIERIERTEIRKRLKENNIDYIYFKDFVESVLPSTISTYLFKRIEQFTEWLDFIETDLGYLDMVKSEWEHVKHEVKMSAFFYVNDADERLFERKQIPAALFTSGGFDLYLDEISPDNLHDVEWLSSFSSSEGMFSSVGYIHGTDNTCIVAGYLKSVEQLLANLIIKHAHDNGYQPEVEYDENGKHHVLTIDEAHRSKATLGKIERYVTNSERFISDSSLRHLFSTLLQPWIKTVRNGHFHKDVIRSYGDICLIRDSSFLITLLILNIYYYDKLFTEKKVDIWRPKTKVFELDFVCKKENKQVFLKDIEEKRVVTNQTDNFINVQIRLTPNYLYLCRVWLTDEYNIENDYYVSSFDEILHHVVDHNMKNNGK